MFNVIYQGILYKVHDITNDSYIVADGNRFTYLPKSECEVV